MDTIFALSSGAPPCAIAIMRLSGPEALAAAAALAGDLPEPRVAGLRSLRDPANAALLDRALVLIFPAPHSATGEDVVELHLHGGRAVVGAVDRTLAAMPGLRRAEAGEFTRRALMAGRIDLTEAEGLGDLLAAETEMQRRQALALAEGGLRRQIDCWTGQVVAAAAQVEAALDFADEDDVPRDLSQSTAVLTVVVREMRAMLARPAVERLRDGIRVVIAGPPNSGKSTLLNALCERDAAIVTPIAGTTRDVIEVPVVRGGIAYILSDTAGVRDTPTDDVEAIGIDRAVRITNAADIVLWLGDRRHDGLASIWIYPRIDQPGRGDIPSDRLGLSAATGTGLAALWSTIERAVSAMLPRGNEIALNARQRQLVERCADSIEAAIKEHDQLIFAENLRLALASLHAITGKAQIEDVLDSIFENFCIGK